MRSAPLATSVLVVLASMVEPGCIRALQSLQRQAIQRPGETSSYQAHVEAPRSGVFDAALGVAQALNLDVVVLEKSSGLIRFENASLSPAQLQRYCAYPVVYVDNEEPVKTFADWSRDLQGRGLTPLRGHVNLTFLLRESDADSTSLNIRGNWYATGGGERLDLTSNQAFEAEIHRAILAELGLDAPTR